MNLTHLDPRGQAHMVDISPKPETHRVAIAEGRIRMAPATLEAIAAGTTPKGDLFAAARIAAILAAKRTGELIPLCHPLPLTQIAVDFALEPPDAIRCTVRAETVARTGVEMEALTGCAVALLTLYDMAKALDRGMVLETIQLIAKRGGKSGEWSRSPS
ncbi:MAG: cyclic pyranopterin monophosphate synthase MoaC [Hydrogenophilus sp.]|nr:cyclic pyranopterin monophosphate synthase MoaC [Hydrogenophilus sp.]